MAPSKALSASDPASERQALKEFERNPPPGFPTLATANIEATKAAIKHYTDIVAGGGWVAVPDATVKPGESHFAIVELRDRLRVSGELAAGSSHSEVLDDEVVQALKAFQTNNGLTPTGRLDKPTVAALNVPAADRLKQLKTNLSRLTEMAGVVKAHRKYVVVNIPAAQVESVALNKVITRHTGVVGKVDRPDAAAALDDHRNELQSHLASATDGHFAGSHPTGSRAAGGRQERAHQDRHRGL